MSNYWKEKYGHKSNEFIKGVIAGVTAFATWENGAQRVGIVKQPLEDEIQEIKDNLGWEEEPDPPEPSIQDQIDELMKQSRELTRKGEIAEAAKLFNQAFDLMELKYMPYRIKSDLVLVRAKRDIKAGTLIGTEDVDMFPT